MDKKILKLVFINVFLFILFSCNEKISIYDLCLNPELQKKYEKLSINDYTFDEKFIETTWNEAEHLFDIKKYKDAIYKYKEILVSFACKYENHEPTFNKSYEATTKNFKIRYFSLYNIACCYSLLKDYKNAELYLIKAIESGYPYLDHIIHDDDIKNYFEVDEKNIEKIKEVFYKGNDVSTVIGKKINFVAGPSTGSLIVFIDENTLTYNPLGDGSVKYNDLIYGTYTIKNYNIIIHFYKEEYCDLSNSEQYYLDIFNGNYTKVSLEINENMVLPLSLEENNKIVFSEM